MITMGVSILDLETMDNKLLNQFLGQMNTFDVESRMKLLVFRSGPAADNQALFNNWYEDEL